MATVQVGGYHPSHHKITKPRGKMVKPILKKLAHTSSPKNSLDLDRGWEDQTADLGWRGNQMPSVPTRSARDVSFTFPPPWEEGGRASSSFGGSGTATPVGGGGGLDPTTTGARNNNTKDRVKHVRSTSSTSQGSGHRHGGAFVHPYAIQQTPRTETPPLSYANSFSSFDNNNNNNNGSGGGGPTNHSRDYSPEIITENEDDDLATSLSQSLSSHLRTHSHHHHNSVNSHTTSISQSSLRRPSLASQRTSSMSDIQSANRQPPLRVNTNSSYHQSRSQPGPSSRLAHGMLNTSYSHSDLQLNISPSESPRPSLTTTPSSSAAAPMSPLRSSLDIKFRMRSRSDVDTGAERETIREARRKFQEKEKLDQEKYEAEQRKKRERKDSKLEKAAQRKNTGGSDMPRPSFTRKRSRPELIAVPANNDQAQNTNPNDFGRARKSSNDEKQMAFASRNYESVSGGITPSFGPDVQDVRFTTPKRNNTAKRKTQGYWTGFILWLRTRLLRLSNRFEDWFSQSSCFPIFTFPATPARGNKASQSAKKEKQTFRNLGLDYREELEEMLARRPSAAYSVVGNQPPRRRL